MRRIPVISAKCDCKISTMPSIPSLTRESRRVPKHACVSVTLFGLDFRDKPVNDADISLKWLMGLAKKLQSYTKLRISRCVVKTCRS
jgi:hypothetical protein